MKIGKILHININLCCLYLLYSRKYVYWHKTTEMLLLNVFIVFDNEESIEH